MVKNIFIIKKYLSNELTKYLGKGYSVTNLKYMRTFYKVYPSYEEINEKLSWTHYYELMIIKDIDKRKLYEKECVNSNWSIKELQRQLNTSLFERLLLSDGDANKEKVLELAKKEPKPLLEKDLEQKLIRHIEDFLLKLG